MSGERGKRTTVAVGRASAEVSLIKTSAKPREAQHEVRRFRLVDGRPQVVQPRGATMTVLDVDPEERVDPLGEVVEATRPAAPPVPTPEEAEAEEWAERGVALEDGTWVNLTDGLDAIDQRVKLEGMVIEHTVAQNTVPRSRVRDSQYVVPAAEGAPLFLASLWRGLRDSGTAALVRWTVRTNQALGAIVARGSMENGTAYLELLTLEWDANLRKPPTRALLPVGALKDSLAERAAQAMLSLRKPPSVFVELRDERAAQRAELLAAARQGAEWAPPEAVVAPEEAEALAEELAAVGR